MVNCNFRLWTIASVLSMFTLSCSKMAVSVGDEDTQGSVQFVISPDFTNVTKSDVDASTLTGDMFRLELVNSEGTVFKRWDPFTQMGETVPMNTGTFTARASYGDPLGVGFNEYYYYGETTFTVQQQKTAQVKVEASLANTKVKVVFGNNIKEMYPDYSAYLYNIDSPSDRLIFGKDCSESGYITSGQLILGVDVVDKDGKEGFFKISTPITADPKDFLTLNVDTKEIQPGQLSVNITIDNTTKEITTSLTIPLGGNWLPKSAPKFIADGFDATNNFTKSVVEGLALDYATVSVNAEYGIQSCTMEVLESPYLLENGSEWPASKIDLSDLTESQILKLKKYGLLWTVDMKDKPLASISFLELAKKLPYIPGSSNEHKFQLTVVDAKDKKATSQIYVIKVTKANISIEAINDIDSWSHSTVAILKVNSAKEGNPELLFPQVSLDGTDWVTPSYTSSIDGNKVICAISNLVAGKTYQIRAAYNRQGSAAQTFKTEGASQVGNNGFEDFYRKDIAYSTTTLFVTRNYTRYEFYPWAEGASDANKYWATNNSKTCRTPGSNEYQNAKQFFSVNYTSVAHSGQKAVEMRNLAVGGDAATPSTLLNTRVSGQIWLTTDGNENASGRTHKDRPTAMEFWYKYSPNGSDYCKATVELYANSQIIAEGTFTTNATVPTWTKAVVNLTYSVTNVKADKLAIKFQSSTQSGSDVPTKNSQSVTVYNLDKTLSFDKVSVGSLFTVDDVQLIYAK